MDSMIIKGVFSGVEMAFAYASTRGPVEEIILRHNCDPAAAHLLSRAVTVALLSAAVLPEGQRLNICWKYNGTLRNIVVDAGQDGSVRGFIAPAQLSMQEYSPDLLYGELGDVRTVTSNALGKILNSGTTPVSLHDVVKDLAYSHCISDQIETGMSVMIGFDPDPEHPVHLCRGLMIQALPESDLERFNRIRNRMEESAFRKLLGSEAGIDALVEALTSGESDFTGLHMDNGPSPHFFCPCSREKMAAVVRTIPIPDRMSMVQNQEPAKIQCQFCNRRYELSVDECIAAWNSKDLY